MAYQPRNNVIEGEGLFGDLISLVTKAAATTAGKAAIDVGSTAAMAAGKAIASQGGKRLGEKIVDKIMPEKKRLSESSMAILDSLATAEQPNINEVVNGMGYPDDLVRYVRSFRPIINNKHAVRE